MKTLMSSPARELGLKLKEKLILGSGTTLISFVGDLPEIDLGELHALLVVDAKADLPARNRVLRVGPEDSLEAKAYPFLVVNGHRYQIVVPRDLEPHRKVRLDSLLHFLRSSGINISTVRAFGELFSENIIRNIPEICRALSVKDLQGKLKGIPAILIASGPSLNEAIPALKDFQDKSVLIAADSLISFLPAAGIEPLFYVTVDPQKATHDKINGSTSNAILFFHPAVFHLIPREWQGPLLTTSTRMAPYQILQLPYHGHVEEDVQCQMHLAFNLASWMGCDPIILVGQDLCYHGEKLYADGAQYIKGEDVERVLRGTFEAKNVRGEIVQTTTVFESYRTTYERKIRAFPGRVFNATEGGLNIVGAENTTLEALLSGCSEYKSIPFGEMKEIDEILTIIHALRPQSLSMSKTRLTYLNDCLMVAMGVLPGEEKLLNMVRAVQETLGRIGPD